MPYSDIPKVQQVLDFVEDATEERIDVLAYVIEQIQAGNDKVQAANYLNLQSQIEEGCKDVPHEDLNEVVPKLMAAYELQLIDLHMLTALSNQLYHKLA